MNDEERATQAISCFHKAASCASCILCLPCACLCCCAWIAYCSDTGHEELWQQAQESLHCCCESWTACAMAPCFFSNVATACYAKSCWGVLTTHGANYDQHMHNGYQSCKYVFGGPCICAFAVACAVTRMIYSCGDKCISCCCPCLYRKSIPVAAAVQDAPAWQSQGAGRMFLREGGPKPQAMIQDVPFQFCNYSGEGGGDFIQPEVAEEPGIQAEGTPA
jgi:hypothetical protein